MVQASAGPGPLGPVEGGAAFDCELGFAIERVNVSARSRLIAA